MFGTLNYNADNNEAQYVERSDGLTERGRIFPAQFACDNCRAKKVEWTASISLPVANSDAVSFQLKCDGQKQGCFRCKTSSTRCLYTRYSNKRERQRQHDANHKIRSASKILTQNQTSYDQRTSSEGEVQISDAPKSSGNISCHPAGDDRILQYNMLSPDSMQELGLEDEGLLFDQLLPDSMSSAGPDGEDPFLLDFSHSSADGTMDESFDNSSSHRLSCSALTSSTPHLSPHLPINFIEGSTPQLPVNHEIPRTRSTYPPRKSTALSESEAESPINAGTRTFCQCPQAMNTVLEETERRYRRVEIQNMHIIIAQVKNALKQCSQILDCNHCSLLSDHMMLAAIVLNKLVSVMEEVSQIYIRRRTLHSDLDQQNKLWNLSIGDYAIDLEVEWAAVMKVLIVILLRRTLDMLECLKRIAKSSLRETQVSMLQATGQKAKKLALNMQSEEAVDYRI